MGSVYFSPMISVIVPIYNSEKYLRRCIKSILDQTYSNLEIILVNDGSTDGSVQICDEFAAHDNRIKQIHKENNGLVSARKRGLQNASGEYVSYVDSDDWIEPDMYEKLVNQIIRYDADIVTSGIIRNYKDHFVEETDYIPEGVYELERIRNDILPIFMYTGTFYKAGINIHLYNKLFKRELVVKNQMCINEKIVIGDDAALIYPCIMDANKIVITHKSFYHYCIRSDSIMSTRYQKELSGFKCLYNLLKNKIQKYGRYTEMLMYQLSYLIMYMLLLKEPQTIIKVHMGNLIPFSNMRLGERVILYGGGKFGSTLQKYFTERKLCEVILWVDKTEDIQRGIMSASLLEQIPLESYDKIIIAVLAGAVADDIYSEFVEKNIDSKKIVRINLCSEYVYKTVQTICDGNESLNSEKTKTRQKLL